MSHIACFFLLCCAFHALGIDNGLGKTPEMGYNTWYDGGRQVSESTIRNAIDFFLKHNMKSYGYKYINLDDCWAAGRNSKTHVLEANTTTFSSTSLKYLADYVHSKGFLFGIYTDRGTRTCQGKPGSLGYEKLDAQTFASWGVDFVKEDSCHASQEESVALKEYETMRDALNSTGRPMWFAVCGWEWWYAPKGRSLGNSWRIGPDDHNWVNILVNVDANANLSSFSGAGGWNNPGGLLGSGISETQIRAQFCMWAVMAAPLVISTKIVESSATSLETWTNEEVIAVDQDSLGKQGIRVYGTNLVKNVPRDLNRWNYKQYASQMVIDTTGVNIWARELVGGSRAFVFLNVGRSSTKISCDVHCFGKIGFASKHVKTKDLWSKQEGVFNTNETFTVEVEGDGGFRMFKFTPM